MHEAGNYKQAMSNMRALAFLYDNLSDFPQWLQRLSPGQMEQMATLLTKWQATEGDSRSVLPLAEVEKREVMRALTICQGDVCAAAGALGIGKTTLYRRLKDWGFSASDWHAIYQAAVLAYVPAPRDQRQNRTRPASAGSM